MSQEDRIETMLIKQGLLLKAIGNVLLDMSGETSFGDYDKSQNFQKKRDEIRRALQP